MASESKFTPEERQRVIAEADYRTGRGPKPAWLEPKPQPAPVRKEARPTDLVFKTNDNAAVVDAGQEWAAYIEQRISDAIEPLRDAVAEVLSGERASMREHVKAAVDDLRRELAKDLGKLEGRCGVLEPRIARAEFDARERVHQLEDKLDRMTDQFNDVTRALNSAIGDEARLLAAAAHELYGRR
jgi:hypothetical protein